MKFLLFVVIALAIGGGIYYVMLSQNAGTAQQAQQNAGSAKAAADSYNKQQEDLMRQLGQ